MPGTLRRYTLRKPVEAGPILEIADQHIVVEGRAGPVEVHRPPDFFVRNGRPMKGDWLIIGSGNKLSWQPVEVFQDDYELAPSLIVPGGAA